MTVSTGQKMPQLDSITLLKLFRKTSFAKSAASVSDLPPDKGTEVVFAGRSNAGKSSALNKLTDHTGLARVSKTPGRTQLINFFTLDSEHRLVDLPGYGFAKVPTKIVEYWREYLPSYFEKRTSLKGVVLIMDIRHPLTEDDLRMMEWTCHLGKPIHILLNKADKLGLSAAKNVLHQVAAALKEAELQATIQLFSSHKNIGVDEARLLVAEWLELFSK